MHGADGGGAELGRDGPGVTHPGGAVAAVLGTSAAAALWWLYFDVVAIVAEHRLANAEVGREQNEIARDSYSFLHFPMVAGIVMLAMGLKKTLAHVGDPLELIPAVALMGGVALYLLAHVAFRYRNIHTFNRHRSLVALLLIGLIALAQEIAALASLGILTGILACLIAYEAVRFSERREEIRHQLDRHPAPS